MSNTLYALTLDEHTHISQQPEISAKATSFSTPADDGVVTALKIGPALWRIDVNHAEEPHDELLAPEYITGDIDAALAGLIAARKRWTMTV